MAYAGRARLKNDTVQQNYFILKNRIKITEEQVNSLQNYEKQGD
ncbi:MAG: lysis system i-spanin subunit Rz [Arsenophonus sp. NC-CH8-MAG3]